MVMEDAPPPSSELHVAGRRPPPPDPLRWPRKIDLRAFLGTLPAPVSCPMDEGPRKPLTHEQNEQKGLRIAWQYKKYLGQQQVSELHNRGQEETYLEGQYQRWRIMFGGSNLYSSNPSFLVSAPKLFRMGSLVNNCNKVHEGRDFGAQVCIIICEGQEETCLEGKHQRWGIMIRGSNLKIRRSHCFSWKLGIN